MANYTKKFTKPYANGYKDRPDTSTPVTADIKNAETDALLAIEEYLANNAISSVSASIGNSTGVYIATIRINDVDYRIYTPMVRYTSEISEGTKVGTLTFGNYSFDVYAPAASAGSNVSVTPKVTSGTNIAEITVDGTTYQLYAPTSGGGSGSTVTAEATLTEGTEIGKITIDGKEIILYAPQTSSITVDAELSATSENAIQNKVVKAEFDKVNDSLFSLGKCKNLLKPTLQTTTQNDVTCTNNGDGTYTLNGTATAEIDVLIGHTIKTFKKNTKLKIAGMPTTGKAFVYDSFNSLGAQSFAYGFEGKEYQTKSEGSRSNCNLNIPSGTSLPNVIIRPMIVENLNATYDDFVPYTGDGDTLTADVAKINSDVSDLKDGTTPVAKAVADEDGNNIKSTYAKKTEAFVNYSSIAVDLNVLTTEPSLISIGYDATNKPSEFYGGYMFVVGAGYTASHALYQILFDVLYNKTYQRKYYHGAWTDWEETNSGITIDSVLSETSTNPVQNKVVTAKLNEVFQSVSSGKSLIASAITETKTSGNVTYGGTGVGGLATYYDLQAAPVQTAE